MDDAKTKPNAMQQLLTKWAELEPGRCKREGPDSFERILTLTPCGGWQLVRDEEETGGYYPTQPAAEAFIQWLVQQTVVERGWYFELSYSPERGYETEVGMGNGYSDNNLAEAILAAYLQALES